MQILLDQERTNSPALLNTVFGAGSGRQASRFDVKIREGSTPPTLDLNLHVQNVDLAQNLVVEVEVSTAQWTPFAFGSFAAGVVQAFVDGDVAPPTLNRLFKLSNSASYVAIPAGAIRVEADDDNVLNLPEGSLHILGVDPTASNRVNHDFVQYLKFL
jgi:hypothetical protein